ncbi:MAG TPA: hypothetical protein VE445_00650 [Nitrososphaeraceae archaeon]|jgi:hypothetical protein|nr:hypothetical protein [Nitrososphaeraceae archaeon]
MLVQIQEKKQKIKLSQILKNATEEQCFGYFMKISEITDLDEDNHHQITSTTTKSVLKVCVNGLLMSKSGIADESSSTTLSIYGYVADDDDILRAYRSLGIDPYYRIKCNKCDMLGDGYHLYRVLEHINDYHRASFKEIGSYLETLGL